jgi:hypothetical protein
MPDTVCFTPAERHVIIVAYLGGHGITPIAEYLGRSFYAVRQILWDAGIDTRRRGHCFSQHYAPPELQQLFKGAGAVAIDNDEVIAKAERTGTPPASSFNVLRRGTSKPVMRKSEMETHTSAIPADKGDYPADERAVMAAWEQGYSAAHIVSSLKLNHRFVIRTLFKNGADLRRDKRKMSSAADRYALSAEQEAAICSAWIDGYSPNILAAIAGVPRGAIRPLAARRGLIARTRTEWRLTLPAKSIHAHLGNLFTIE